MKKLLLIVAALVLSACASAPKPQGANPAKVTLQFKSVYGKSIIAFWRKIEEDGVKGDRFLTGQSQFAAMVLNSPPSKYKPQVLTLNAGTYYLDSFQVDRPDNILCVSQRGHYTGRNGWDDAAQKPFYLSFTVKEGQVLVLPEVTLDVDCVASFEDTQGVFTVGSRLARK
ncbi:hypothetical protein ACQV5M_18950 [Leptospira sp. SA-E8]|uniref:hypothetical protein n=1 Tax=Leptospira sp. SA-E8 TaxID=3422259 RepID=UPI003EC1317E